MKEGKKKERLQMFYQWLQGKVQTSQHVLEDIPQYIHNLIFQIKVLPPSSHKNSSPIRLTHMCLIFTK